MEAEIDQHSTAWYAMSRAEALQSTGATEVGLSASEVRDRLTRFGPNRLPEPPRPGILARLRGQFDNLLIHVLIAAGLVTALLGHWTDAAVILAVVAINAAIGFWQEGKAENALAAVRGMLSAEASVRRSGARARVPAFDLVPGDIVLLEAGDRVPADLRLTEARGLRVQEAALTGESVAADKTLAPVAVDAALGDRSSMAFSGTLVTAGRGAGVVVATGPAAEIGRIGAMLGEIGDTTTPLLRQIDRFARRLTLVILATCAGVFAYAVGVVDYPTGEAFLAMVGMAVAAIPEGLPAVITITLALGVQRMAGRRAIIRRLPAVETLGAVSVICTDKTGTLTLNEMVVRQVVTRATAEPVTVGGSGYAPQGALDGDAGTVVPLARAGILCNDAHLVDDAAGWQVAGDPMEGALLALAHKVGLDPEAERADHARVDEIPFDAVHKYMATLDDGPSGRAIHVKGAPDRLLRLCTMQAGPDGAEPIDAPTWAARLEALARGGHRVLAFAAKPAERRPDLAHSDITDLTLLGFAGFIDPARPEAVAAIADCRHAGIDVKMITGDHALTALAVAAELGLDAEGGALSGQEIDAMDAAELRRRAPGVTVFARTSPEHKLRLVEALQHGGNVVAMTGDGVNDAPALKRADVGVAMGIKGTEAAKEAARVVLADDNFASIVAAVREGRTIYDNIRKVIAWTLPTNGGETLVIVTAILLGLALPITPVQILWINMVTAVALGLTLAFEPPEPGVMSRAPRLAGAALLDREMVWRAVLVSILFALAVFGVTAWAGARGAEPAYARTLSVNLLVVMEIFYLFSVRYLHMTSVTLTGLLGTRAVWLGIALAAAAQGLFTYAPPLQSVFDTRPITPFDAGVIVALGLALLLVLEAEKRLRRMLARN
ncbi:cation-translocating P-type ATPase [Citreimonas salinaria]|uniref:ATPase, P-type (Transporting), HAD superfamily, subfamily IC n=1 Tax=Citreimonas salinaria TaxID=321339 RepID=A0A1H3LJ13_9RHOB|nr:HAD-IC family P-type ATPase [Citreimonas salinaria]SDY64280.1 ATPase, P-type (transporting), HAD superfamily, subfamily IC [Citreimonas salinaria]